MIDTEIVVKMSKFGTTLTDRADGKKAWAEISSKPIPNMLDFEGVISLGSSFGDEVLPKVAEQNQDSIQVINANQAVRSCISKIVEDFGFAVCYS